MRQSRLVVQPKLTVGPAADPAEREADRIAAQTVRGLGMPAPVDHTKGGADPLGGLPVDGAMEQRINRARSGGSSLDPQTRESMESAMGGDLSAVRVHTDSESDHLNKSLQAKAFTTGSDVFFSSGAYQPHSESGMGLLAHEVAHVTQQHGEVQRTTVRRAFDPSNPNFGSVTSAKKLSGGLANKGVFMLVGEGGQQMVAKFIDEDPRRAQMADEVLDKGGLNSS